MRSVWHVSCEDLYVIAVGRRAKAGRGLDACRAANCEMWHKGGVYMAAVALKMEASRCKEAVRLNPAQDVSSDPEAEYEKALKEYGLPYPDGTWFKRAAGLERQMREARMEAKFDEN